MYLDLGIRTVVKKMILSLIMVQEFIHFVYHLGRMGEKQDNRAMFLGYILQVGVCYHNWYEHANSK
jgi:hypothetical protein